MSYFSVNPGTIRSNAGTIDALSSVLGGFSKELTAVMDDLDSSLERVKPALNTVIESTNRQSTNMQALSSSLARIATAYINTENDIIANIKNSSTSSSELPTVMGSSRDGSEAFDENGDYGANQESIAKHTNVFPFKFWFLGKDNDLYDFIRSHPGYENLTNAEIKALLKKISDDGCGWCASASMIFAEFEGRPEDFEKIFGFPMYNEDGDLNFDQLVIDMYLSEQGNFYIDPETGSGSATLLANIEKHYDDNPEEFIQKYGVPLYDENGDITDEAYDLMIAEKDALIATGDNPVKYPDDPAGMTDLERNTRTENYLKEKGIDSFTYENAYDYTPQDVSDAIDSGKTVVIGVHNKVTLYDENGNVAEQFTGGHTMVVTGVTEDGYYIVSSWGEKFYYKPDPVTDEGMYVYDIYDEAG